MGQVLLLLVVALTVAAVVFGVTVLVTGGDPGLGTAEPDGRAIPLPGNRPLREADIGEVRFDTAVRGYRMAQVDQALRRAAYDIGYKDELIDVLQAEVTALRAGRTAEADALRAAREAALAPVGAAGSAGPAPSGGAAQPNGAAVPAQSVGTGTAPVPPAGEAEPAPSDPVDPPAATTGPVATPAAAGTVDPAGRAPDGVAEAADQPAATTDGPGATADGPVPPERR